MVTKTHTRLSDFHFHGKIGLFFSPLILFKFYFILFFSVLMAGRTNVAQIKKKRKEIYNLAMDIRPDRLIIS